MDCEEIIDQLYPDDNEHKEKLSELICGGQSKRYLGKEYTVEQIDKMEQSEIDKLYSRYESALGTVMTKTLGHTILYMYANIASKWFPISNQEKLLTDLEADPFIEHGLNNITCNLYHRYGIYLSPISAILTTIKHCQFKQTLNNNNNSNGGECGTNEYPTSEN